MSTLKVILLISALSGLLMIVGYIVARKTGMVIALIVSALMNFGSYWFSDSIVLKMYNAQPVTTAAAPVLYEAVESLTGNPKALANALLKLSSMARQRPMGANPATAHMFIVNPLSGGSIMRLFSSHPPIEKRVERLRAMNGAQI